jgi:single-stranded DNA-binding protein
VTTEGDVRFTAWTLFGAGLKHTSKGAHATLFFVAVDDYETAGLGQYQRVEAWGELAERLYELAHADTRYVEIAGRLRPRTWRPVHGRGTTLWTVDLREISAIDPPPHPDAKTECLGCGGPA